MQEWSVPVWAAVGVLTAVALFVVLCVVLLLTLRRERDRTARTLAQAASDTTALRHQVEVIERRLAQPAPALREEHEFVITRLGESAAEPAPSPRVETVPVPVFADLLLRETAVQAVSLAAGLRRALAPEVRHRIRFEMRREVKRARKHRRTEQRLAVREWRARQRAAGTPRGSAA